METQRYGKLLSRTCRNNRNSCYFSPGDQNFADKTAPVLGSRNGPLKWRPLIQSQLYRFACVRTTWPPFWCRRNFCRRAKNTASFDCFCRYATEVLHTAGPLGFHGFAAPRAIVLHALRTFMPTHVLEQFKNMCGHKCSQGVENKCLRRCKAMETQRYGKLLSRTYRNNRNSCYFSPGDQNFADKTAPVLGS